MPRETIAVFSLINSRELQRGGRVLYLKRTNLWAILDNLFDSAGLRVGVDMNDIGFAPLLRFIILNDQMGCIKRPQLQVVN